MDCAPSQKFTYFLKMEIVHFGAEFMTQERPNCDTTQTKQQQKMCYYYTKQVSCIYLSLKDITSLLSIRVAELMNLVHTPLVIMYQHLGLGLLDALMISINWGQYLCFHPPAQNWLRMCSSHPLQLICLCCPSSPLSSPHFSWPQSARNVTGLTGNYNSAMLRAQSHLLYHPATGCCVNITNCTKVLCLYTNIALLFFKQKSIAARSLLAYISFGWQ